MVAVQCIFVPGRKPNWNSNSLITKRYRTPDHTIPPKVTDGKKTKQETCLVCEVVIQGGDDISDKGEDAVFREGICQAWIHRRCLGFSKKLYDNLGNSNDPFCVLIVRYTNNSKKMMT